MKKFPSLHVILFILTIITTLGAGALHQGVDIFKHPLLIYKGFPFSATLIIILLGHELGHYFTAREHHTVSTLPFFIPAPTLIGTFGAVIKMKSPILSRKALVDIGASGPIIGFCLALVASAIGLSLSQAMVKVEPGMEVFSLGNSILFYVLSNLLAPAPSPGFDLVLHPIAFAGWIGLLVTSLNLIPVGQLDGGHIAFAFLGKLHKYVSMFLVTVLIAMGFFYVGWFVWAGILLIIGIKHPPVYHWEVPLDKRRRALGLVALVIFILTFTPFPFQVP